MVVYGKRVGLCKAKTVDDWKLLTKTVVENDPYRHLCSIHGATATYFDYWMPEFTHVSIQDEAPVLSSTASATLRKNLSQTGYM